MYELKVSANTKWRYHVTKKVYIPYTIEEDVDLKQYSNKRDYELVMTDVIETMPIPPLLDPIVAIPV